VLEALRNQLDGARRSRPDEAGQGRDGVAGDGQATDGRAGGRAVRRGPVADGRGRDVGRGDGVQAGAGHVQRRRTARGQHPVAGRTGSQLRGRGQAARQGCPVGDDAAADVLHAGLWTVFGQSVRRRTSWSGTVSGRYLILCTYQPEKWTKKVKEKTFHW